MDHGRCQPCPWVPAEAQNQSHKVQEPPGRGKHGPGLPERGPVERGWIRHQHGNPENDQEYETAPWNPYADTWGSGNDENVNENV